jgi:hypothetical protein
MAVDGRVAALVEITIARRLIAVSRRLIAISGTLVRVGLSLLYVGEGLPQIGERLLIRADVNRPMSTVRPVRGTTV